MFERNRIDNDTSSATNQTSVAATVTLVDGEVVSGHFLISSARTLVDTLNGESRFLEFQPLSGTRRFVAKHSIQSVSLADTPSASGLDAKRPMSGAFDPHLALGVRRDADWDDIREAYLRLAKSYHPDGFAGVELPTEVRLYLEQMSKRINAAYTLLEAPRLAQRKTDLRAVPVYVSTPRA